jgi:all-trans-retinol 13,14-reductase
MWNANLIKESDYPIFFIGSGITSLCAGALLSIAGYKIHILESHPKYIGGHARTIEENGFRFCAGPQYVWNFDNNEIGERILKYLDLHTIIPFDYMDKDRFETIKIGKNKTFELPMGLDNLNSFLILKFPDEQENISHFIKHIKEIDLASKVLYRKGLYLKNGFSMKLGAALSSEIPLKSKWTSFKMSNWSLSELFDHCGLTPEVRRILHGHSGIFSESYSTISAVMHGGATGLYHAGAQFPRFGFKHMLNYLVKTIEQNNGVIEKNKKVIKLEEKENRVYKIVCEDGTTYTPNYVISNISPRRTFNLINKHKNYTFKYKPSNPLIGCYIGVSNYKGLSNKLKNRNVWWYPDEGEVDFINPNVLEIPKMLYVGCPSLNGFHNQNDISDDHSLITFIPGNYEESKRKFSEGSIAYENYRKDIENIIVQTMDTMILPGIMNHIRLIKTILPQDLVNEFGFEAGNVYGRRLTAQSILEGTGKVPEIKNLLSANATIGMPGVATAFQTAAILYYKLTGIKI